MPIIANNVIGLILLICAVSRLDGSVIVNGSFETGNLSGWTTGGYIDPFYAPAVRGSGQRPSFAQFFTTLPTDGTKVFSQVFDSDATADPWLGQGIGMVQSGDLLSFDYRLGWDYTQGRPATMTRSFLVKVFDTDTMELLFSEEVFNADLSQMTVLDTGPLTHSLDLTPYAGRNARVEFVLHVPELHTGPGHFQLDNVQVVPEVGTWSILLVGAASFACRRTRYTGKESRK